MTEKSVTFSLRYNTDLTVWPLRLAGVTTLIVNFEPRFCGLMDTFVEVDVIVFFATSVFPL